MQRAVRALSTAALRDIDKAAVYATGEERADSALRPNTAAAAAAVARAVARQREIHFSIPSDAAFLNAFINRAAVSGSPASMLQTCALLHLCVFGERFIYSIYIQYISYSSTCRTKSHSSYGLCASVRQ